MANIWLVDHYVTTPETGIGGRHFQMAHALSKRGHKVTVIAAHSHHMLREGVDRTTLPHIERFDDFDFVRIDVPTYAGAHDKRRILAWLVFAIRLWRQRKSIAPPPTAILYVWPQPIGFVAAKYIARTFGARLILEVRDIWPETLVQIGRYNKKHPFILFLKWLEKWSVRRADRVVSNLEGADQHLIEVGMDRSRFTWLPNGVTLDDVRHPAELPESLVAQVPRVGFRIVYTGTLGAANSIETLIDALALLRDLPQLSVILVGDGKSKETIKARCKALGLTNVYFFGAVSKAQVQSILMLADACFIGWKDVPLYDWGIGANKVPEYLYSGKPILHSYSGKFDPVERFCAGITVPAENPDELAKGIRRLISMPEAQRLRMGKNGRTAALEEYDYSNLAVRLEKILTGS